MIGITTISGLSSYSGLGGSGDYIVATQTKKPQINIWQWGKPNVHMQCHVQEITTTITSDINGFYICGGTKGGRIFLWEVSSGNLILSWQAHFKAVTVMSFTPCGNFLISGSEDGMVRVWDIIGMVNPNHFGDQSHSKNPTPFRSVCLSLCCLAVSVLSDCLLLIPHTLIPSTDRGVLTIFQSLVLFFFLLVV